MKAWEDFLKNQEAHLGKKTTEHWLKSLKVLHFDACNLYLEAKDPIQVHWFEEHIRPKIKAGVKPGLLNNNHRPIKVHLTIAQESLPLSEKKKEKKTTAATPVSAPSFSSDPLDPQATWENFIHSAENQITLKLLQESVLEKTSAFNPVYLYGPSGCGKTHLLMALAQQFANKGLKSLYIRAQTFTEHFVCAIRQAAMREFRKSYRNVDLLLIDDVSIFARRLSSQEELFHTFNTLQVQGKQILLASSSLPQNLEGIEPRLISRFEWGICLKLECLGSRELRSLLEQRLQLHRFPLEEDTSTFLLQTFKTSKSLVQAVEALILRAHLAKKQNLTLEEARAFLKDLIAQEQPQVLSPERILSAVASSFDVSVEDILSKSQRQEHAAPRQVAIYLLRHRLKFPFKKIGKIFARDHSTIMSSVRIIEKKVQSKEILPKLGKILSTLEHTQET